MNRRNFLSFIGAGIFFSLFTGCGETSKKSLPNENKIEGRNFTVDDIKLNSGYKMPVIGLGTWTLSDKTAADCVYHALKIGYRLIDTAQYYGNEIGVGEGIKRAIDEKICTREEIFLTTKVMPGNYRQPDDAIKNSLKKLNLDYVDLFLIHQPGYNDDGVYKALERGVKNKIIRSIGISNYYTPKDFERILNISEIVPAVVQNENHPLYQNTKLQEYLKKYGTVIESWYPLGGRGNTKKIFENPVIKKIAEAHKKSSAQIILRWQIQADYIAIPGSGNFEHIEENFNIFDFELSASEMQEIFSLNQNKRFENW